MAAEPGLLERVGSNAGFQALQRIESASQTIGPGNHQKLFAVAPQPRSPGSSNSRIRSRLRAIYPFSLGVNAAS